MLRTQIFYASSPKVSDPPRSAPLKFIPYMMPGVKNLNQRHWVDWQAWRPDPFRPVYREKNFLNTWPGPQARHRKGRRTPLLPIRYSPEALQEAVKLVPDGFFSKGFYKDVRRPPERIKAYSDGIVHDWWMNYWTLHSVRYQLKLCTRHLDEATKEKITDQTGAERVTRMTSNYDEYRMHVDYEETKLTRDYRSRWINIHRSLEGMSEKIRQVHEENRYHVHKKRMDDYWASRKILINRVKAMRHSGSKIRSHELPVPTFRVRAFDQE